MAPQKTTGEGDHVPTKQVNNILQNLRGEHFRHARNIQRKPVPSSSLSSYAHNQPTLPINLIYPSPPLPTNPSRTPGPSPPRSWQLPATPAPSSTSLPSQLKNDVDIIATPEWREHALSPLFSACGTSSSDDAPSRLIYPDPSPIPQLTLLCLQLIRSACPESDLAQVAPYIPPHLRRALLRYTAIHAPLSQTELDALRQGATHIDTELIVVGPYNTLRGRSLRQHDPDAHPDDPDELSEPESWDAQDGESLALRTLAVLSSPLVAATVLALPPTITHLALVHIPQRIALHRLPAICPLLVFLDLSYNTWLHASQGAGMLGEVEWHKWHRLAVLGLRACAVTPKVLMELHRGRWEDVKVIQ